MDNEEDSIDDIVKWVDKEDDDFDERVRLIIIVRAHCFTGDQQNYKGMPATSVVDAMDRALDETGGAVSGLARR